MATLMEFIASRVAVRDAEELDEGIYDVLKKQLQNILTYFPAVYTSTFKPELDALLKTALWMFSVERSSATFGQQLLHLKYENQAPRYKLRLLGILRIGSSYLKERLLQILSMYNNKTGEIGYLLIERLSVILNCLDILYFIIFLRRGGPSSFYEHLLKIKPISTLNPSQRTIGYSFMTRELLWHGLIELLVLVLPLINFHTIKRLIQKVVKGTSRKQINKAPYTLTVDTKCPICHDSPIIPFNMGCSHIFCHYCLASHRLADQKFECPECGFSDPEPSAMMPVSIN